LSSTSSSVDPALAPLVRLDAGWRFTLYPDAGEGGGFFQHSARRVPDYVARGAAVDAERAAEEAGRRARATLRRYCAANRLNRLGTLTFRGEGCHHPALLRVLLGDFFRALQTSLGGKPFPYAWVPEWHPKGHGLHAHFVVGRFIKRSLIESAWGHGFVHIKLLGDLPTGSTNLGEARRAAGYLSKYVAKSFADPTVRVMGLHRYDVAQGFKPQLRSLRGSSPDEVLRLASEIFGSHPTAEWASSSVDDWQGPPAIWAQWGC
jgi:hypothetical protein